jgi:arylsulfatase A-like enzyme
MYDGGLRVPAAARWPGVIAPGSKTRINVMHMDVYATACNAANVPPPHDIDGVSFLPALKGENQPDPQRDMYFIRREGGPAYQGLTIEALRRGDWKIVHDSPFAPLELYNLQSDPKEENDLAAKNKGKLAELSKSLRKQIQRGGQTPWQGPERVE